MSFSIKKIGPQKFPRFVVLNEINGRYWASEGYTDTPRKALLFADLAEAEKECADLQHRQGSMFDDGDSG